MHGTSTNVGIGFSGDYEAQGVSERRFSTCGMFGTG
jgi:hypothetical protein